MSQQKKRGLVVLLTFGMLLLGAQRALGNPPPRPTTPQTLMKKSPPVKCKTAFEITEPCEGVAGPTDEILELLHLRNVKHPQALLDWQNDVAQAEEDIAECLGALEDVQALAEARGRELDAVDAGHSTWTVVGWAVVGLTLGFGAGYLTHALIAR
jgi:hypothetical protein